MVVNSMTDVELSIIVPIHNDAKYIEETLASLTLHNSVAVEIIIIDDGSTDSSLSICKVFAKKCNNIKVIHIENNGIANARNVGLNVAKGKWIAWCDGDDIVASDYITQILKWIKSTDADIIIYSFLKFTNKVPVVDHKKSDFKRITKKEALRALFSNNHNGGDYLWNKVMKKRVFKNVSFPKGRVYEDTAVVYKCIDNSAKIYASDKILYYYRQHSQSIMHNNDLKKMYDAITARKERLAFFAKRDSKCKELEVENLIIHYLRFLHMLYNFEIIDTDKFNEAQHFLKDNKNMCKKLPLRWKAEWLFYFYLKPVFIFIKK